MRRLLGSTILIATLALGLSALSGRAEAQKANGKIRVVLIDGQNNHNWRATTPVMKKALEDTGRFTVDVSTNLSPKDTKGLPAGWKSVPFPPDLSKYDVLLSNYNGARWPADFNKSLEDRLAAGQIALVIVHAANNSFGGWKEYDKMLGMGWRNNNYGDRLIVDDAGKEIRVPKGKGFGAGHGSQHPFKIVVRDRNHPITKGMPAEWMHTQDELYQGMRGPIENVHLLATAYADKKKGGKSSSNEHEPMIWTVMYGKGRVFHTPMGHDVKGMLCVGFITTLARGTEWAATGAVTLPIPPNFPTADKVSSAPGK